MLAIHKEHGIVTAAYGPLQPVLKHATGGPIKSILARVAERLSQESGRSVDAATALLLWTKAKGAIAVSAAGKPENIKQLGLIYNGLPDLTAEEVEEISVAGKKVHWRAYVSSSCPGMTSQ